MPSPSWLLVSKGGPARSFAIPWVDTELKNGGKVVVLPGPALDLGSGPRQGFSSEPFRRVGNQS